MGFDFLPLGTAGVARASWMGHLNGIPVEENDAPAETSAVFTLCGDFDPAEITALTGITPSRVSSGEGRPRIGMPDGVPEMWWQVRSRADERAPLGDHIESVLSILAVSWESIVDLCTRHEAGFACRSYVYDAQGPELSINRQQVMRIAELRAFIDFDLYSLGDDQTENPGSKRAP